MRFTLQCIDLLQLFLDTEPTPVEAWQSQSIRERPEMMPREVLNYSLAYRIPVTQPALAEEVEPNLPWAEDHFQERVSGEPLNPPPSEQWWPFAVQGNQGHKKGTKFSHTYPERMWPKKAGEHGLMRGVRFLYGDLEDVVRQLKIDPTTRQAYLPIWFPEDTGAVHGERVPCTLGYHFLIRGGHLQITYYIRSCDFLRHFRDDVYMASRLAQWMVERFNEDCPADQRIGVGMLYMHIVNLHVFEGDVLQVQSELDRLRQKRYGAWAAAF